jgi:hypothetical protein
MNDREIIDYQSPTKNDAAVSWRSVLVGLLAIASVLFCLFACFAALDSAAYAKKWKQYGMNPALGAQIEADVQTNAIKSAVACGVVAIAWIFYFRLRWRRRNRALVDRRYVMNRAKQIARWVFGTAAILCAAVTFLMYNSVPEGNGYHADEFGRNMMIAFACAAIFTAMFFVTFIGRRDTERDTE